MLFSHPKDVTPVCTTELGYTEKLRPDFAKRNAKVLAVSVDSVGGHKRRAEDIKDTQGYKSEYPIIADTDRAVATLYE